MLRAYIRAAMQHAHYEIIDQPGADLDLKGLTAEESTRTWRVKKCET